MSQIERLSTLIYYFLFLSICDLIWLENMDVIIHVKSKIPFDILYFFSSTNVMFIESYKNFNIYSKIHLEAF